jgi:hypothetical protein
MCALTVTVQLDLVYPRTLTSAKDVKSFMSEPSNGTTDSAQSAVPKFFLGLENLVPETTRTKCSKCKETTPAQWVKIQPTTIALNPEESLEFLFLAKRIIMCQICGNITVTK